MPNADLSMCCGDGCWVRDRCWHHAREAHPDRQRWHEPPGKGEERPEFTPMEEKDD